MRECVRACVRDTVWKTDGRRPSSCFSTQRRDFRKRREAVHEYSEPPSPRTRNTLTHRNAATSGYYSSLAGYGNSLFVRRRALRFFLTGRVEGVAFTARGGGGWRVVWLRHSPLREPPRCRVRTHKRSVLTAATRPPASPRSSRRQATTAAPQPRSAARCPPHLPGTTRRVANLCIATADAINRKRPEGWGRWGGALLFGERVYALEACFVRDVTSAFMG